MRSALFIWLFLSILGLGLVSASCVRGIGGVGRDDYGGAVAVDAGDAASDGGVDIAPIDSLPPKRTCSYGSGSWQLGPVERVAELSSKWWEGNMWLTSDGLTMYLSSGRSGSLGKADIFAASRSSIDSPFGEITTMLSLNSPYDEDSLSISDDGLSAALASNALGGPVVVMTAVRQDAAAPWTRAMFAVEPLLPQDQEVYDPELSGDGLRIYYSLYFDDTSQDVFWARRATRADPFAEQGPLAAINTDAAEADPTLSPDEQVIVFASNRPGSIDGSVDLWFAVRSTREATFGTPAQLPTVNTAASDGEPFLSADGCVLYFGSDRPGGAGSDDIYRVAVIAGP